MTDTPDESFVVGPHGPEDNVRAAAEVRKESGCLSHSDPVAETGLDERDVARPVGHTGLPVSSSTGRGSC